MTSISIEALGLSREELNERIVARAAENLLADFTDVDEDGNPAYQNSKFARMMQLRILKRVDKSIDEIAGQHVLPNVTSYLEQMVLTETNKWGERTGKPCTFIEYLTKKAGEYLLEEVNFEGKTKEQSSSYSWSKAQTRVTHLIHAHLHYSIEHAMKAALKDANSAIVGGIAEAVKIKLAEVQAALKITVAVK